MQNFSQSYPELMNQAVAKGYDDAELSQLFEAFKLSLEMSNGIYRAQGVPLINHLVSSASIVMSEDSDVELVIASLLHAVYVLQKFDDSKRSWRTVARRAQIRSRMGESIESLLWGYELLPWYKPEILRNYIKNYAACDMKTKRLLVIKLANEVDDRQHNALGFTTLDNKGMRSSECLNLLIRLAETMNLNIIKAQLQFALETKDQPPEFLRWNKKQGYELETRLWKMGVIEKLKRVLVKSIRRLKSLLTLNRLD